MATGIATDEPMFQDNVGPGEIPEEFRKEEA